MNKGAFILTTVAALTMAPLALAQEPSDDQDDKEDDSRVTTTTAPVQNAPSTTTLTSAEPAEAPMRLPRERETIVAKQTIRPHRPLLLTGSSIFIGAYATTAGLTALSVMRRGNGDRDLYLPMVGPWMHLLAVPEGMTDRILIATSGVLQGAGLAIGVLSFFIPEKIPAARIEVQGVKLYWTATSLGKGSTAVGATGEF